MSARQNACEGAARLNQLSAGNPVYAYPAVDLGQSIGRLIFSDVPLELCSSRTRGSGVVLGTLVTRFSLEPTRHDGLMFYLVRHRNGRTGAYLPEEIGDPPTVAPDAPQDVTIAVGIGTETGR